jgi:hypothetical protein
MIKSEDSARSRYAIVLLRTLSAIMMQQLSLALPQRGGAVSLSGDEGGDDGRCWWCDVDTGASRGRQSEEAETRWLQKCTKKWF